MYSDSVSALTKKEYQSRDNFIFVESLLPNKIYYWRVAVHSERLGVFYSDFRKFKTFPELTVFANYPNPFNVATRVQFSLPFKTKIKISVFNSLGEILEVIADDEFSHGIHSVEWNADKYSSGIYIINVRGDYFSKNLKAILIKGTSKN